MNTAAQVNSFGPRKRVHLVVTCTNRKTRRVASELRAASLPPSPMSTRCRCWIDRLREQHGPLISAADLYCGEHWYVAANLPSLASGEEAARLWACSAGYGLIRANAPIRPYSATFAPGHQDSVGDDTRSWWKGLSEWDGPEPGQPRTLSALVEADPEALFLVMLSVPYLLASLDDISEAIETVSDSDRFILVSAGAGQSSALSRITVPADARLQNYLGGTLQALNARIGGHLLSNGIRTRSAAVVYLSGLLNSQPPRPRYERKKLSDDEVLTLIADRIGRSPEASASRMLRELRDEGFACEQSRFGALHRHFKEVNG